MANINNVKLGACDVTYKSVALGHVKDGVEVTYEPDYADISVDAYGSTIVQKVLKGEKLMVKMKLAELTIANLRNAIPQSEFAGAANARITIGHKAGQLATAEAGLLEIHPTAEGTRVRDIALYKAYVVDVVTVPHNNDEPSLIEVTFLALLDETKQDGNYLGLWGDSTA